MDPTIPHDQIDCASVIDDDLALRYVRGELADSDRDAFEEHFFACDSCTALVTKLDALRGLPSAALSPVSQHRRPAQSPVSPNSDSTPSPEANRVAERQRIIEALERCAGNQTRAAASLGLPRRAFVGLLDKYSIMRPQKFGEPRNVSTATEKDKTERLVALARAGIGASYNFLAATWALTQPLDLDASPPEIVRQQLLEQAFREYLEKTPAGPIRNHLEALRQEAMSPGSTWPRSESYPEGKRLDRRR